MNYDSNQKAYTPGTMTPPCPEKPASPFEIASNILESRLAELMSLADTLTSRLESITGPDERLVNASPKVEHPPSLQAADCSYVVSRIRNQIDQATASIRVLENLIRRIEL